MSADGPSSSYWRVGVSLLQLLLFMICVGVGGSFLERRQKQQAEVDAAEARRKRAHEQAMIHDTEEECEQLGLVAAHEQDADAKDDAQDVRRELDKLRLGRYADAFLKHGYDYWPEILRLPRSRVAVLVEVTGMPINHGHRFREQLAVQREAMGIKQVG